MCGRVALGLTVKGMGTAAVGSTAGGRWLAGSACDQFRQPAVWQPAADAESTVSPRS